MKKLLFIVILILLTNFAFAEFQLDPSVGYFFNTDNYDGIKRAFNGLNLNISARYLFIKYIGVFFGGDFKAWFSADNDDYAKQFQSAGMTATFDDTIGCKLDFDFGLALAYPVSEKFGIQGDLGLSATVWGIEAITGTVKYLGQSIDTGIFLDKLSGMGIYANIFGRYLVINERNIKSYLSFGLRIDRKFTRKESGEVITGGITTKYSDTVNDFSSFSIAPFIGLTSSF